MNKMDYGLKRINSRDQNWHDETLKISFVLVQCPKPALILLKKYSGAFYTDVYLLFL